MEVFIRDKNCATCPFSNKEKLNFIWGDSTANDIGLKINYSICMLNYFAHEENCPLKSLDQHDAELKAKWCEELIAWVTSGIFLNSDNSEDFTDLYCGIKQKLKEMKGEK